jgi:DNA-binding FadR family transcriptional regulator|tara:strand:- start:3347 stop:4066 length:720 start_codon:yes stop_codon:yes gene_type:complete
MKVEEINVREASRLKADEIIHYVQERIDSGDWPNGYKIPTEKSISSRFAAARNTVRKALSQLESEGIIERHVGRGTFVKNRGGQEHSDGASLSHLAIADASPADVNEIRVLLEPAVAELAVARAARSDILHAKECFRRSLAAKKIDEFEHWDAQLHAAVIAATKNDLLIALYDAIQQARQKIEWYEIKRRSLDDVRRGNYDKQHGAIVDALEKRDAIALRGALSVHLTAVNENMLNPRR